MKQQVETMMGVGIAIGIGIGTAIGVALNNISMGIAFGVAFGIAFGGISRRKEDIHLSAAARRTILTLLGAGILATLAILGYALVTWQ